MSSLNLNKPIRTLDGHKVLILMKDYKTYSGTKLLGVIHIDSYDFCHTWDLQGKTKLNGFSLINVEEKEND